MAKANVPAVVKSCGGRPRLVLDRDRVRRLPNERKNLREISDTIGLSLTTTARILKTA
jgi:hypothetical protein